MYPFLYFGDFSLFLYDAISFVGSYVVMFYNDLRVKNKPRPVGYKTMIVRANLSQNHGKISRYLVNTMPVLESETFTMAYIMFVFLNRILGDALGTGANYFGAFFIVPILWVFLSVNYGANPLEQLDFVSTCLPFYLIFVKLSCFTAGCCSGIAWEHGMYNITDNQHQVPVQLIEAFWGLLILVILTQYRKKAKTGTVFPMYAILYSSTRFISEFLRSEENVFGPLKLYHILCLIGIVYGIIFWIVVAKYRDRVNAYYDKKYMEAEEELVELNKVVDAENEKYRRQMQSEQQKKENKKKRNERQKKAKSSVGRKL